MVVRLSARTLPVLLGRLLLNLRDLEAGPGLNHDGNVGASVLAYIIVQVECAVGLRFRAVGAVSSPRALRRINGIRRDFMCEAAAGGKVTLPYW
jgi:hypothetical protein